MKTKLKKLSQKAITCLMILVSVFTSVFATSTTVFASELVLNEATGYSYTGVRIHLGYAITHDNIYVMKMDGKKVFSVESSIFTTSGAGYIAETYLDARK